MSKVAENADVSQKTYRTALDMLDVVKESTISYGKDPKALATTALYAACLVEEKENCIHFLHWYLIWPFSTVSSCAYGYRIAIWRVRHLHSSIGQELLGFFDIHLSGIFDFA